ncbi:MAG: hypothetical protein ABIN36_05845 [Ferruginibacter sp.]
MNNNRLANPAMHPGNGFQMFLLPYSQPVIRYLYPIEQKFPCEGASSQPKMKEISSDNIFS